MSIEYVKSFKSLSEKDILLISQDEKIINLIKKDLIDLVHKFESTNSILNITSYTNYDLIIIDMDKNDLSLIYPILSKSAKDTPIIYITSKMDNNILHYSKDIKLKNIIFKNEQINFLSYYLTIILEKSRFIMFKDGYYFDIDNNEFFHNNRLLKLTTLETDLLKFLIKNRSEIVTYEEIEKSVWKDSKFTIYGMRNLINKIREKSYYDIISNITKTGYTINNYHFFN